MHIKHIDVKNCRWSNAEHTVIDCDVNFEHLTEEYVPFSACATASSGLLAHTIVDPHVKEIFDRAVAGDFGPVAEYVAPAPPSDDELAQLARMKRDQLLVASDWTQLPDVPQELKNVWAQYRQDLRNIPTQLGFPRSIVWPTAPQ